MSKKNKAMWKSVIAGVLLFLTLVCSMLAGLILLFGVIPALILGGPVIRGIGGWIDLAILIIIPVICTYLLLHYHLENYI